jgi:hypothetical protein
MTTSTRPSPRPKCFWLHRHFKPQLRDRKKAVKVSELSTGKKTMSVEGMTLEEHKTYLDLIHNYGQGPEVLQQMLRQMNDMPSRVAVPLLLWIMEHEGMLEIAKAGQIATLLENFLNPVQETPAEPEPGRPVVAGVIRPKWTFHCGDVLKLRGLTDEARATITKFGQFWSVIKGSDSRKDPALKEWFLQSLHWKEQGIKKPASKQFIECMLMKEHGSSFEIVDVHSQSSGPFNYKNYA